MEEKEKIGEGVRFERIRRITGYLVGTLDRFNNAKRQEVMDRVTHTEGNDEDVLCNEHQERSNTEPHNNND